METKSRVTLSLDTNVAIAIDTLCFPLSRSRFVNELLKECLQLLKEKKIELSELKSPVLRKTLSEFHAMSCGGGVAYA